MLWAFILFVGYVAFRVALFSVLMIVNLVTAIFNGRRSNVKFHGKGGGVWDHPSGSTGDVWLDPRMWD